MKKLLCIVTLYVLWMSSMVSATHKLTIITSDDQHFTYDQENDIKALKVSNTINNLLDDLQDDDIELPLPKITAACWQIVVPCLDLVCKRDGLKIDGLIDDVSRKAKHQELIATIASFSRDELYAFIQGINYLNHGELLDIALKEWADKHYLALFEAHDARYALPAPLKHRLQDTIKQSLVTSFSLDPQKPVTCLQVLKVHERVSSACYSPDGARVASASFDGTVRIWDAASGALLHTLSGHTNWVTSVCYSPDGTQVASASYDNTVRIWDATSGALLHTLIHTDYVTSVCYSPDGTRVASASYDNTVRIWDAMSGSPLHTLLGHTNLVYSACYSPDGTRVASASNDCTVRIWDAASGALLHTLSGHTGLVKSVCYSPDGAQVASASDDDTIRIWNAGSGALLYTLPIHMRCVASVCYSPDSAQVASVSDDKTVRIWNARSGAPLHTLLGHTYFLSSACYSPDGTQVASASDDKTIRIWDAASGALLHTLTDHTHWVSSACYSPDGTQLASASHDMTVRIWDVMLSIKKLLASCSDKQCLLLALAYQKKRAGLMLDLDTARLFQLFDAFTIEQQALLKKIFPIKRSNAFMRWLMSSQPTPNANATVGTPGASSSVTTLAHRSLLQRMYAHNNRIMFAAGLGALGYLAWHHYKK